MKRVLILDDDANLTFVMDLLFAEEGASCVIVHSLSELEKRKQEALSCDTALFDINLGTNQPTGLDAYRWMHEQNYSGKIVFFTGHAGGYSLVCDARKRVLDWGSQLPKAF